MTLGEMMRLAATKSRKLSSPKSKAGLRNVVLQNRMVNDVNKVLASTPLSTRIADLDKQFISIAGTTSRNVAMPLPALWQLQNTAPSASSYPELMACPSEEFTGQEFTGEEFTGEEFTIIGDDSPSSVLGKRTADDAFEVVGAY